ncbi:hypothetical protein [Candidatus Villigracilis saccharophilus]|uniref:hypothetical protein n=1 Tax=Candidatus Villigracilis saccharophilus TaxID=3140684 RepID=UPI003135A769|nr:insulinase family protein [Anaerolineales bacterium]
MAKRILRSVKPSLPGPDDIYRVTLSNGITVLARSSFDSPSISMSGYLPAGAIFESDAKLGLADFVASSLMRGTQTRHLTRSTTNWNLSARAWGLIQAYITQVLVAAHLWKISRFCLVFWLNH